MKVAVASGVLTIKDASDGVSFKVTAGPYAIKRAVTQAYVEVSGAWGTFRINKADVSHLNASTFSGTLQQLFDALVTGLSP